ncbi:Rrf2 family transcriptional regulator [Sporolactobacillus pectinivorans]|uniref:Rrf2 family transcriptional regulator n=1 Tax=Sporolactobacillus pectinivorans TaxID=1591408 RepID=UPI000C26B007|nr:Rrf2 family transcriptional regulator [Sporolactobacillus pectinivorans]
MNSHYTIALHILTMIAFHTSRSDQYLSSEKIAGSVNTNSVFIRRILGKLKKAQLVNVHRGGVEGGWKLARPADVITLLDVYTAVEKKPLFEMHYSLPNEKCPIGCSIQSSLKVYYGNAEAAMKDQLRENTIADLLKKTLNYTAEKRMKASGALLDQLGNEIG